MRVFVSVAGVAAVVECGVETWKWMRGKGATSSASFNRLVAAERAERD
ncbi:hypothetical protein [Streptomyces phaeoluteigriseus]